MEFIRYRSNRSGVTRFSQGANGAAGRAGGVGDIDQLAFAEAEYGQKFGVSPSTVDTVALATLDEYNPGQSSTSQPFAMKPAVPSGAKILSYWHTHGASSGGFTFDFFSKADVNLANYVGNTYGGVGGCVGTPAGNAYFIGANALNPGNYPGSQFNPAIFRTQRFVGHVAVW